MLAWGVVEKRRNGSVGEAIFQFWENLQVLLQCRRADIPGPTAIGRGFRQAEQAGEI